MEGNNNALLNNLLQTLTSEINANNWNSAVEISVLTTSVLRGRARKAEKAKRESEKKAAKK